MTGKHGEVIIYASEDGLTKITVNLQNETVWLSLDQTAELFQRDKSTISRHIKNVFAEGELQSEATVANFAPVQNEGNRQVERTIEYYNLDVIISGAIDYNPVGEESIALQKAKEEYRKYQNIAIFTVEKAYLETLKTAAKTVKKAVKFKRKEDNLNAENK
ncbi:hypothetical protein [Treponema pedis]|uniref:hypothetical protein n=1 Tax=Treponema pedis TaxID=409322 RepID=UPI00040A169C|nr:hypothetical protein [Treponema pedis]